ncbi:unnamed protein product [Sphagnum balticum]
MSIFNPESFLDASTTEALTKRPPLPAGSTFIATVGEPKSRTWQGKQDPTKSGIAVDLPLEIDMTAYPEMRELIGGATKVTLKGSIMLDLNEQGAIDWGAGKNSALRRYREALGLNQAGVPFSIRQMQGRQLMVKIKHREYEGELFDDIDTVARIS